MWPYENLNRDYFPLASAPPPDMFIKAYAIMMWII